MFKKIKENIIALVAEFDARHELYTQQALSRFDSPKMTSDDLKQMMNEANSYIDKVNKGEKVPEYIDPTIEQKKRDEEFVMFRKGQIKNEINNTIDNMSGLQKVQFYGSVINEIRKNAQNSNSSSKLKP
jgi:hypothetical protein